MHRAVCIDKVGKINPIIIPTNMPIAIFICTLYGNIYTISVTNGARHVPINV